jgi:hypothetical protein
MRVIFLELIILAFGLWCVLIAHFYGTINPDQIYFSENSTSSRPHSPGSRDPPVPPCVPSDNSDGAGEELMH